MTIQTNEQPPQSHRKLVETRAAEIYGQSYQRLAVRNDRLLAKLLVFEWIVGIGLALCISPLTYAGTQTHFHIHLYAAIFFGLAVISFPIFTIYSEPGAKSTRFVMAIGQMIMTGLLIDLTGGRLETHFLIFGSLAFLAFYLDWRVIVIASVVTAVDHWVRGSLFPRSIYGVDAVSPWRWLEHAGYVAFEDIFLISSGIYAVMERKISARREAELEIVQSELRCNHSEMEQRVAQRTSDLSEANTTLHTEVIERKRNEAALSLAEALLSGVMNSSLDGVMAFEAIRDVNGTIEDFRWRLVNPSAQRLVGKTSDELVGRKLLDIFPGNKVDGLFAAYVKVVDTAQPMHLEHFYAHDGLNVWYEISAVKLGDGFSVTFGDITLRKANDDALRHREEEARRYADERAQIAKELLASERFAKSTVDALSAHIAILDEHGTVLAVNKAWKSFASHNSDCADSAVVGTSYYSACENTVGIGKDEAIAMADGVRAVICGDKADFTMEYACHSAQERRWFVGRVTRFPGDGPVCVVVAHENITTRKLAEEALKGAKDAAEAATRSKSEFLANMSHEIRTPITAIVGFADMMLDPDQTPSDRVDGLQTIRRNARHLLDVINEILDLSKIEAGRMTVEIIPTDIPPILSDVLSMMRPRAIEKGLDLSLRFTGDVPRTINSDPVRVKQILVNLVSNALKFTEQGKVEIHVFPDIEAKAMNFEVIDSGIGITAEQMTNLFKPFTQADGSTTRRFGGTGLGLTISKRLAEMLGGEIHVRSAIGVGSAFSVSIAGAGDASGGCCRVEDALVVPQSAENQPLESITGRVLLAEDGKDNQRFISAMLRKSGLEVVVAENGRIAVEKALAGSFDLILMDMQMPEMDGYAATSRLRSKGVALPIIALTAHAMADDRAKCVNAGCTDYLTKPINRKQLIHTVALYLKKEHPLEGVKTAGPIRKSATGMVISTCENDPEMADILPEFVSNLPKEVASLESLLNAANLAGLYEAIHQLKGAGGSYGFHQLTDAAAVAEHSVKVAAPIEQIKSEIEALMALIRNVKGYSPLSEVLIES